MNKKCIGCGATLQNTDINKVGYVPNLNNKYCQRCFRLKHYGDLKNNYLPAMDEVLAKVNSKTGIVFFMMDYLSINKETIDIFKKIREPKTLIISKCDLLRPEMKYSKISKWLKNSYDINDDIVFTSIKKNTFNLLNYMDDHNFKKAYIMGLTNAGKSTFLNKILKLHNISKEIVVSDKPNTTLDFISFKIDDKVIYDTPGFYYSNCREIKEKELKPISYRLRGNVTLIIDDYFKYFFKEPNHITLYLKTEDIKRDYKCDNSLNINLNSFKNCEIVLPGLGFINVKEPCVIKTNIENVELRKSISEDNYE